MEQFVRDELGKYNDYVAEISNHESYVDLFRDDVRDHKLVSLKAKIKMMDGWMKILLPNEAFIVKRHLIDKLIWSAVAFEYSIQWGEMHCRTTRSLKIYQASALKKMVEFAVTHQKDIRAVFSQEGD